MRRPTPKIWRRIAWIGGSLLAFLLLVQLAALFWLGPWVGKRLEAVIATSTEGSYHFSHTEAKLSLFEGKFVLTEVKLWPDSAHYVDSVSTIFVELSVPRVEIKSPALLSGLRKKRLHLSGFHFSQPDITLTYRKAKKGLNSDEGTKKQAYTLNELTRGRLKYLSLEMVGIDNATVHYRGFGGPLDLSEFSADLRRIEVRSKDTLSVDWLLTNADLAASVKLAPYRFVNADSSLDVSVEALNIETRSRSLSARSIDFAQRTSQGVFRGNVKEIVFNECDLVKAYRERRLHAAEVLVIFPQLDVFISPKKTDEKSKLKAFTRQPILPQLYPALKPYLSEVSAGQIALSEGKLAVYTQKIAAPAVQAQGVEVRLLDFKWDSTAKKRLLQAEDLRVSARSFEFGLVQERYRLSGQQFWYSSKNQFLTLDSVRLRPTPLATYGTRNPNPDVYSGLLPNLVVEGLNLDALYFDRKLLLKRVVLTAPDIDLVNYPRLRREQFDRLAKGNLYSEISSQLAEFSVENFQLGEGKFTMRTQGEEKGTAFRAFDLRIAARHFRLAPGQHRQRDNPFYADSISVSLDVANSIFPLGENQLFTIGRVGLSSRDSSLRLQEVRLLPKIEPVPDGQDFFYLYLPEAQLQGLNFLRLFRDGVLHARRLDLRESETSLTTYADNEDSPTNAATALERVPRILGGMLTQVSIEEIYAETDFRQLHFNGDQISQWAVPRAELLLTGFQLDTFATRAHIRQLFSQSFETRFHQLRQPLGDGIHEAILRRATFDSKNSELRLDSLGVVPSVDAPASGRSFEGWLPSLRLHGLTPAVFFERNRLRLDSLVLTEPNVRLTNYPVPDSATIDSLYRSDLYAQVQTYLQGIRVDHLRLRKGRFQFRDETGGLDQDFTATDLGLSLDGFILDSTRREGNPFTFDKIALAADINHYAFLVADSGFVVSLKRFDVTGDGTAYSVDSLRLTPIRNHDVQPEIIVPQVRLTGVSLSDLYFRREASLGELHIQQPDIYLPPKRRATASIPVTESPAIRFDSLLNLELYPYLAPYLSRLHIRRLFVDRGTIRGDSALTVPLRLGTLTLTLKDLRIDSLERPDRLLWADDVELSIQDAAIPLPDSLYILRAAQLRSQRGSARITLDSLKLIPRFDRYTFGRTYGAQVDRIEIDVPHLVIEGADAWDWYTARQLIARRVTVKDVKMDIFRDQRLPRPKLRFKPLPQAALRKLDFPVEVDSVVIENMSVRYSEHQPQSDSAGTISFDNIFATVTQITNRTGLPPEQNLLQIDASAYIMDTGYVVLRLRTDLNDTTNAFTVTGLVDTMGITALNPMLIPVAFIEVESGIAHSATFTLTGDNEGMKGRMRLYYDSLEVALLRKRDGEDRGLLSFLANRFVVREANPRRRFLRVGRIDYDRPQKRSIFNYLGKGVLTGVKSSVGLRSKEVKLRNVLRRDER